MFKIMEKILDKFTKKTGITEIPDSQKNDYLLYKIKEFKLSKERKKMTEGLNYYKGIHDIEGKKRLGIGERGEPIEILHLPNNKITDNQYKKLVDQKSNYLVGKPLTLQCENETYIKLLHDIFDNNFYKTLKSLAKDSLNCGIAWLYLYYDERGSFKVKRFNPVEILPIWKDEDHTELDFAVRLYEVAVFEKSSEKIIEKVEVYDQNGIAFYTFSNDTLKPCEPFQMPYISIGESGFNWDKIPLIPFKFNDEIPLLNGVKSLQDAINLILSNFQDEMSENTHNTVLVLVNYDGENLGEFRRNLATYGAVKISSSSGDTGDVRALQVEVNHENYTNILQIFKKAIIENGRGFDAKDDRVGSNPNQMNIQSMYADIDLDANGMELEFSCGLDLFLEFINLHLSNTQKGEFSSEHMEFKFNRDVLINTSELIENIQKSFGLISDETLIAKHPFVTNLGDEVKRIEKQKTAETLVYKEDEKLDVEKD